MGLDMWAKSSRISAIRGQRCMWCATSSSFSNGLIERQVGLSKHGFGRSKSRSPELPDALTVERVAMARNLIPSLNSGVAPLSAMAGRSDILASLEQAPQRPMVGERQNFLDDVETSVQRNIHELTNLRSELIVRDARRIVSTCDKRRLRDGAKYTYVQGERECGCLHTTQERMARWVQIRRTVGNPCVCGKRKPIDEAPTVLDKAKKWNQYSADTIRGRGQRNTIEWINGCGNIH